MRYYYFHDGEHQSGPFEITEIAPSSLKPDTAVWHTELEYWVWAKQVEELKDFIKREAAPQIKQPPSFERGKIKDTLDPEVLKQRLKLIVFALLFIGIFVITLSFITSYTKKGIKYGALNHATVENARKRNSTTDLKTKKSKTVAAVSEKTKVTDKESLKERERIKTSEKREPAKFLILDAKIKPNLLGNKMMITASITNTARLTKYQDVLIEITYYNKYKDVVGTSKEVAYVDINPGASADVRLRANMPPGGRTAECRVLTAIHHY